HQAALESGNVEAVATWEPWSSVLENAKAGKVLADSSSGVKRYLQVFLARNDFAQQYPDIAVRFVKANEKALQFIKTNPDAALELIAKESKLPAPVLARIVKETDWDAQIVPDDVAAFQQVKDFLQETKVLKKDYDINELFDDRYFKQLPR
ncbi:MAG: ABC transporter substrate-binding protein, partial [Bacillota bacterium]